MGGNEAVSYTHLDVYKRQGQLVTYNGFLYVANVDNASGVPGESPDFTLLSTLQPIGPTAVSYTHLDVYKRQTGKSYLFRLWNWDASGR